MEKKKNTRFVIVIVILSLLVIGFGGFIAYNNILENYYKLKCVDDKNDKSLINNVTYKNVEGLYSENGTYDDETYQDYLYLYENGTFIYTSLGDAINGYMGNYIIVNNEINLNYIFAIDSTSTIKLKNDIKILTVTDNNVTANKLYDDNQKITLNKTSSSSEKEFLSIFDFSNYINNHILVNEAYTNSLKD